ncbi:Eco29kI family restriction endonuclease [Streptomyces sp. APSN-46.1]|uniref:Eco29kI family restriction endonuclease n=1 Tax=Streptomyces sp. APSN-46.1 TaxID=2929049 RepID=UPI001FB4AFFA|nr:Eco29kI family restriction endonuclease [Streptomyces sp. APSN-46.1]MCJ1678254.1 Eco29kI family restriction endonuclease [Streptomyces sp. APSN-46.1]
MVPSSDGSTAPSNFNPLSIHLLSSNLRAQLDGCERVPLDTVKKFPGAGLYALYYKGDLPLYGQLKGKDAPIYVGKAEAGNSSYGEQPDETEPKLFNRITDHRKSISEATNLEASHFDVRYLVLDDIWIVLGERALLRAHSPVLWNTLMTGFGSNPSGGARKNGRSIWDSIHPGRKRAQSLLCNRKYSLSEMEKLISDGINISLQQPGPQRDKELTDLKNRPAKIIWEEHESKDKRCRVFRKDIFLEENNRLGVEIDPDDWVLNDGAAGGYETTETATLDTSANITESE